jgi:predicted bacteriocin transport accessory protein
VKNSNKLLVGLVAVVAVLVAAYFLFFTEKAEAEPKRLISGDEVFDQPDEKYLVYFYQDSCPYCQQFKPTIEAYQKLENAWPVYYVNLEKPSEQKTWDELNIIGTPTIFGIDKTQGKISVMIWEGVVSLEELPLLNES